MKYLISSSSIILSIILMLTFNSTGTNTNEVPEEEDSLIVEEGSEAQPLGQSDTCKANTYYDVPLSQELQDYTREICEEYDVDVEIILGIMKTESDFRHNVSSKNNIGGKRSVGITQLNENHVNWYRELTQNNSFNINNIKDNIKGGVLVYHNYKSYWQKQGYEGEELISRSLLAYNRGVNGSKKYIKKNGINHNYVTKVLNYKNNLNKI